MSDADPVAPNEQMNSLRQQAEARLGDQLVEFGDLSPAEIQQMVHELRVHQIELEMQNEELNQAQQELAQLYRKYADMYDLAPVGYLILDERGVILEANLTSAALLETSCEKLAGTRLSDFIELEDQDKYYLYQQALFKTEKPTLLDLRLFRVGQPDVDIRLHGAVVYPREGSGRRAYVALTNMSLLRLAEHDRDEAQEANRLKNMFLAMISHELRTPLTSIFGFASTLAESDIPWKPEQVQQFGEIISTEAKKMLELADQLMDAARLQAGVLSVQPEVTHIEAIIERAQAQLDHLTNQHELIINLPASLPGVVADKTRIAQVLTNLVNNARKHSPEGTSVTLSATAGERHIQIEVSDQGHGILPEERELVFEAFHQGTIKSVKGGVGLGLAICKGLVEAHGGSIWVKDQSAPGTTIAFTLPVAAQA